MKYLVSTISLLVAGTLTHPTLTVEEAEWDNLLQPAVSTADVGLLTYALALFQVKHAFYRRGLEEYEELHFTDAGFHPDIYAETRRIAEDEARNVQRSQLALMQVGSRVPSESTYKFHHNEPKSFVAMASIINRFGLSRRMLPAKYLFSHKMLAPHANIGTGQQSLPTPLDSLPDFEQTRSLAWPFFVSCPLGNPKQQIIAFPRLKANVTGPIWPGGNVVLLTEGLVDSSRAARHVYGVFVTPKGSVRELATAVTDGYSVRIPEGLNGDTYFVLTFGTDRVSDGNALCWACYSANQGRDAYDGAVVKGPFEIDDGDTLYSSRRQD